MSDFTNPAVQAMNLIRYIGDQVSQSGKPIPNISSSVVSREIGAPSREFAQQLIEDLCETQTIRYKSRTATGSHATFLGVTLTLGGWEKYEAEKRDEFAGNYGFIAMKFGDPVLDGFVRDVVKPAVKAATGCDLVDMRDVAQAGIIDDIMRVQIRDSKFVIADLTHDNYGAYWEAGYAEGLGKPVIYICEEKKFREQPPHFDTNHCTTVPWSADDGERFREALTATLRRSLDPSR